MDFSPIKDTLAQTVYDDEFYYITGPFPAFPEVGSGDFRSYGNMPGVRCKTCAAAGKESWVIEGKNCPECGTAC
jgi:hypothetical protein